MMCLQQLWWKSLLLNIQFHHDELYIWQNLVYWTVLWRYMIQIFYCWRIFSSKYEGFCWVLCQCWYCFSFSQPLCFSIHCECYTTLIHNFAYCLQGVLCTAAAALGYGVFWHAIYGQNSRTIHTSMDNQSVSTHGHSRLFWRFIIQASVHNPSWSLPCANTLISWKQHDCCLWYFNHCGYGPIPVSLEN